MRAAMTGVLLYFRLLVPANFNCTYYEMKDVKNCKTNRLLIDKWNFVYNQKINNFICYVMIKKNVNLFYFKIMQEEGTLGLALLYVRSVIPGIGELLSMHVGVTVGLTEANFEVSYFNVGGYRQDIL